MDDAAQQLVEVVDVDEALGDADEGRVVAEQAPDQRDAERALAGERELEPLRGEMMEPFDRAGDLTQGRLRILENADEKAGAVFLDPALDVAEDLRLGHLPARDREDPFGLREKVLARGDDDRAVLVGERAVVADAKRRAEPLDDRARFRDPRPGEMVEHLAADSREQLRVGSTQEIEDHAPLDAGNAAPVLVLEDDAELFVKDLPLQPGGDRLDEPPLLFEERSLVGCRALRGVADVDVADDGLLHAKVRGHHPWRLAKSPRCKGELAVADARLADLGKLPAWRNGAGDAVHDLGQGDSGPAEQLLDRVKAVELLRALAKRDLERVELFLMLLHRSPLAGGSGRPSVTPTFCTRGEVCRGMDLKLPDA